MTPQSSDRVAAIEILLEDGPLIAVNKPAGLLTQGVPQAQASLESLLKQHLKQTMNKPGNVYLGVPHRLDRPVSGIVVFARNSKAAARLAEQFRERSVQKIYLAITEGVPNPSEGTLVDWLLKDADLAHVSVVEQGTENAKRAVLDYEVIAVKDGRALVRIELQTGRMHQIRVQFASRGWPIVGDAQYGASPRDYDSVNDSCGMAFIALHAWRLQLKHPIRYDTVQLEAPLPANWSDFGFVLPKGA